MTDDDIAPDVSLLAAREAAFRISPRIRAGGVDAFRIHHKPATAASRRAFGAVCDRKRNEKCTSGSVGIEPVIDR